MSKGGFRWGSHRVSVENCHSLSAWGRFQWVQFGRDEGFKCSWWEEDGWVILNSKRDGFKFTEQIPLLKSPCHFGGSRFWFACPSCGRRVGKLYLPTNIYYRDRSRPHRWLCHYCYKLTYEQRRSRNLSQVFEWRAERIAQRLIVKRNHFYKPKGMRWKTFERLVAKYNDLSERSDTLFLNKFASFL
jgi:hypothetical protein